MKNSLRALCLTAGLAVFDASVAEAQSLRQDTSSHQPIQPMLTATDLIRACEMGEDLSLRHS